MVRNKIWITTIWKAEIEPVVTSFDNQEAANLCAQWYKEQGYNVCVDECKVYHSFLIDK